MTKVAILPERSAKGVTMYRAVAGAHQAVANTAGAALDALTAQLSPDESGTLVVVQHHELTINAERPRKQLESLELFRTMSQCSNGESQV